MNIIEKWLKESGVSYSIEFQGKVKYIVIVLEKDCVWVNGFNEKMLYDRKISIHRNTYGRFSAVIRDGYASHTLIICTGKQKEVVKALEEYLPLPL